jgi:hypothetical protein
VKVPILLAVELNLIGHRYNLHGLRPILFTVKGRAKQLREFQGSKDKTPMTQLARLMKEHRFFLEIGANHKIQPPNLEIERVYMARCDYQDYVTGLAYAIFKVQVRVSPMGPIGLDRIPSLLQHPLAKILTVHRKISLWPARKLRTQ